jgi:hypothetical protein
VQTSRYRAHQDYGALPLNPLLQDLSKQASGFDRLVLALNPHVIRVHRSHAIDRPTITDQEKLSVIWKADTGYLFLWLTSAERQQQSMRSTRSA